MDSLVGEYRHLRSAVIPLVSVVSEDAGDLGRGDESLEPVDEVLVQILSGELDEPLVDVEMQRREEPGRVVRPRGLQLAEQELTGFGVLGCHCG